MRTEKSPAGTLRNAQLGGTGGASTSEEIRKVVTTNAAPGTVCTLFRSVAKAAQKLRAFRNFPMNLALLQHATLCLSNPITTSGLY